MKQKTFPDSVQPGIPKLREPDGHERRLQIGDLFDVVSRPVEMRDNENYRLVTVRRSRGGVDFREELPGRKISVKSQFYVRESDFLISKRQIVHGACGFVPAELDGAIVSNEYSVLRCRDVLKPEYLKQLIHTVYLQQTFFHSSIGVHIEKMIFKLEEWFKWPLNLPALELQNTKSGFLSAVDEKIAQLMRKKALLEDYKKACMQQLFSQKVRFKDDQGNDFPDWEEKQLGEMGTASGGGTPVSGRGDFWFGQIPWISSSDLVENSVSHPTISRFISEEAVLESATSIVPAGTLLIVSRVGVGKVGIAPTELCTSQDFFNFQPHSINGEYLAYYLLFHSKRLKRLMQGTSIKGVTSDDMKRLEIEVPHLDEQSKIVTFLRSLEHKCTSMKYEIQLAQTFKKGLLQQMFA